MKVDAARIYEGLFVPALFGQFAPCVADAAGLQNGDRVLDVACGTGALSREVQKRVAPAGNVVGVDASDGMIRVASDLAPEIQFTQGTAESLEFPNDSFDAVVCQFGLMFFDDGAAALREMIRVLKPYKRLAVAVWESLEDIPAYVDVVALIDGVMGAGTGDSLRAPFSLGDVPRLRAIFEAAGIPDAAITTRPGAVRFDSIETWLTADVKGWLPIDGPVSESHFQAVLERGAQTLAKYCTDDGSVYFPIHAHLITATKSGV